MEIRSEQIKVKTFGQAFLASFAQVVLLDAPLSGALIVAALFLGSIQCGIAATLGCLVALLTHLFLATPDENLVQGLAGYNGILSGIAAVVFLESDTKWLMVVVGAVITVGLEKVLGQVMTVKKLPYLTFPFIAWTWLLLLASYSSGTFFGSLASQLPLNLATSSDGFVWSELLTKGIGEIYLLDSVAASCLIGLAIFIGNWQQGLRLVGAILASLLLGILLSVSPLKLTAGLYTYNLILTFLALGTFLPKCPLKTQGFLYLFGALVTFLLDMAFSQLFGVVGLPVLTFSFVLATWLTLRLSENICPEERPA